MKNRKKVRLMVILTATLIALAGCTADQTQREDTKAELAAYEQALADLEETLRTERSAHAAEQERLQGELAALRHQLAALGTSSAPTAPQEEPVRFTYRLEEDGAVITAFEGNAALLAIPGTLDGHPVVAIGERAFEGTALCAVFLPEGIRRIGWFAFYGCTALSSITLPESVDTIGYAVFDGCDALTVVCPAGSFAARYAQSYGLYHITT
jgi:hypothetical protein